jgi:hypothetical protein
MLGGACLNSATIRARADVAPDARKNVDRVSAIRGQIVGWIPNPLGRRTKWKAIAGTMPASRHQERTVPFKSKAQRRKFAELLVEGKIKPETFEEWNRETGKKALPEKVKKRKPATKAKAGPKKKPAAKKKRTRRK